MNYVLIIKGFYFFTRKENEYILLHGFTKTTKKTPKSEIDKAELEMKKYIKNYN